MKRYKILLAIAVVLTTFGLASGTSFAEAPSQEQIALSKVIKAPYFEKLAPPPSPLKPVEQKPVEPPKPVVYTVAEGDNLTKIAENNQTTWQRIWQKNTQLANPDTLNVGQQLTIPFPDEKLEERSMPVVASAPVRSGTTSYAVSGNGYAYGYCTWYVKNRRPDLPNNLGNANTWFYMAQNDGLATGTVPRVGAVGTTTAGYAGHVVIVEAVNGDGTIRISEMNAVGWNVVSSRTASASSFLYIY